PPTHDPPSFPTRRSSDLIGRGIDLAVFHGRQPLNGAALAGIDAANVLANTTNEVDLSDGNMIEGLLEGYDLVARTLAASIPARADRKSTRLNSSHVKNSY